MLWVVALFGSTVVVQPVEFLSDEQVAAYGGPRTPRGCARLRRARPLSVKQRGGQYGRPVSRLIHLNGPPGIGKSTLAKRYADEHPGVLNCDIDVLRTLIGGWQSAFQAAGELIRPAALAMIEAYLANGHDVVLPQMLVNRKELARFEAAATGIGAQFVERVLMDTSAAPVARFARRGASDAHDPWHDQVRAIVAANGGDAALAGYHAALERLLQERPSALVIKSTEGATEDTYQKLIDSLG